MRQYIQEAVQQRLEGRHYPFVVFDKHANQYAGCTRLYDINNDAGSLLIGYTWYGERFQGTGLNGHCKALLLRLAFEQCGFERVEFRADAINLRSIKALLKIGCTAEGVLRSHLPRPSGSRCDTAVFSLLKAEWLSANSKA